MDLTYYTSASSRKQCIIKERGENIIWKLIKRTILDISYNQDYHLS